MDIVETGGMAGASQRLTDRRLIEILLGGSPMDGEDLSEEVLDFHGCSLSDFGLEPRESLNGRDSAVIGAAFELGRRFYGPCGKKVRSAQDAFPLLQHYADRPQEQFIAMTLNGAHEVIATRVVTVGLVNRTLVHPREVFAHAIQDRAVSIIMAHNHPSGQLEPSDEDREATRRLYEAGRILGIALLDHLILGPQGKYLSFIESGLSLY